MCVYIYIYIYIHIHTYIHTYIHIYIYTYIEIYTRIHTYDTYVVYVNVTIAHGTGMSNVYMKVASQMHYRLITHIINRHTSCIINITITIIIIIVMFTSIINNSSIIINYCAYYY